MADQDGSDASPPESQGEFLHAEKFTFTHFLNVAFKVRSTALLAVALSVFFLNAEVVQRDWSEAAEPGRSREWD